MRNFLAYILLACTVGVHSEKFDFIIVGAGTAGLVIASRLSEDPSVTVAVVEPGPDVRNDPEVYSTDFSFDVYNASINYIYSSIPQPQLGNRTLSYRAGKAIGGTSIVNGLYSPNTFKIDLRGPSLPFSGLTCIFIYPGYVYIRGHPTQYDAWEELGNAGWNWDSLFSYGKQLEHLVVPNAAQAAAGAKYVAQDHGFKGPLTISFPFDMSNSSFYAKITKTFKSLGLGAINDVDGPDPHGNALAPLTVDRDTNARVSSASAYYQPVDTRTNLKIIKGTVKRIVWARNQGRNAVADGVEYVDPAGKLVTVYAAKDVILSASVYRNPLILEGSGVGNPK
jgi:choline dehydrogenase